LTSLSGLNNIDPGSIIDLSITNNSLLSACEVQSVCDYLASPGGAVEIHDNAPGCNSPDEVQEACESITSCLPEGIIFNTQAQIDSFQIIYPDCTEIEGFVEISGEDIINLNGLNALKSIRGTLILSDNYALTTAPPGLAGLENISTIGNEFIIQNNDNLTDLTGLDNLTSIDGPLRIFKNDELVNLKGLDKVNSIGGGLRIGGIYAGNNSLINLTGLEGLVSIEGELVITLNHVLANLSGLDNLTSIGGRLHLGGLLSLTSLTGLNNLTSIGGGLCLIRNISLTSLTGLNNVSSIGGSIEITFNSTLTDLTGLDNINASSIVNLKINNNDSLAACAVQSICDYLVNPNGTIEIFYNAPGCNFRSEVQEVCDSIQTSFEEIRDKNIFIISPNPLGSNTEIKYTLHQNSPVTLQIIDLNGRVILNLVDELQKPGDQTVLFNGNELRPGIYFCLLKTNECIQSKKMIIYK